MNKVAIIFGIGAIALGIYTGTAHNVVFGLMAFALVWADRLERKSEKSR